MEKQRFLSTLVNNVGWDEVIPMIDALITDPKPAYIVEVNADVMLKIEKDAELRKISDEADLTLIDGKPLIWISKWLKKPIKDKISGSDLAYSICELAGQKGYSLYILGGQEGVAELAAAQMAKRYPGIRIAGTYAPPWHFEENPQELEKIRTQLAAARPDILLVCLGCPKQEKWTYENYKTCGAALSFCCGATVDFMAGRIKRAPKWMSDHGLEWFYRFLKEPTRLFKRYFIDDMRIFRLAWKYRGK